MRVRVDGRARRSPSSIELNRAQLHRSKLGLSLRFIHHNPTVIDEVYSISAWLHSRPSSHISSPPHPRTPVSPTWSASTMSDSPPPNDAIPMSVDPPTTEEVEPQEPGSLPLELSYSLVLHYNKQTVSSSGSLARSVPRVDQHSD